MTLEPEDATFSDDEEDWGPGSDPPSNKVGIVTQNRAADSELFRSLARLMVGGAAEGSELFFERLRAWNISTERRGLEIYHEAPDESRSERLRFGILGLATKSTDIALGAVVGAAAITESAYGIVSGLLSPLGDSRLMRPLVRRYDDLAARGEVALERWIDAGRTAEQRSRALVRQAYDEGSTEVIQVAVAQLAEEPAVRDLVSQQSIGMAGEMVDVLRKGAASTDVRWGRPHTDVARVPAAVTTPATAIVTAPADRTAVAGLPVGGLPVTGLPADMAVELLRPAGFVSRLLAFVLDVIIVTIGSVILGLLITLVLNFLGLGAEQLRAGSSSQILQLIRTLTVALSGLGVLLFVPLYFIVFWSLAGATPGKRLLGLRIVHAGQPRIAWPRALWRYIGYFLSALPLFLGYFWVMRDRQRQAWHDKLADTHVVYTWDVPSRE
jgi:uncharacterized RDD family membrane protein YckC